MALIPTPSQLAQRGEFYYQLGQLTATGVGVTNAIDLLTRKPPSRSYRQPLLQLRSYLAQGDTFSDALARLGLWTPAFDIALIEAGERSGRLDAVFTLLANYYADRAVLVRRALSDLAYPVFLFHFSILLFPMIEFFQHSNVTVFLLQTAGVLIPLYVLTFGLLYSSQGRRSEKWRAFVEKVLRPIPVVGSTRQSLALARLSVALESLINAGVNIIEAWDLAAAASGSPALRRVVAAWRPQVVAGLTPADAVSSCREFPELFANLYHTGEISGQLDQTLRRLYLYYLDEGTRKMRIITAWFPRMVYLGVAVMVGYKVVSFYAGMAQTLNNVMGP